MIDLLRSIGQGLQTPLGFIAGFAIVLWSIAFVVSYRAERHRVTTMRLVVCAWMIAYCVSLFVAYLTPLDRDALRLYVALLLGWNVGIATLVISDVSRR